jgi:hypothetical protein
MKKILYFRKLSQPVSVIPTSFSGSTEQAQAAPTQINVVLNWFEELKRRVAVGTK